MQRHFTELYRNEIFLITTFHKSPPLPIEQAVQHVVTSLKIVRVAVSFAEFQQQ